MFKGSSIETFTAHFSDLPHSSLLTLNMHTPNSWLVESVYSPYDLDNILLSEVAGGGLIGWEGLRGLMGEEGLRGLMDGEGLESLVGEKVGWMNW